jgi:Tol biopolymer transport system component
MRRHVRILICLAVGLPLGFASGGPVASATASDPWLAFSFPGSYRHPQGIVVLARDGTRTRLVSRTVSSTCQPGDVLGVYMPTWSPDGTRIAFVEVVRTNAECEDYDDEYRLAVIDAAGGDVHEVVSTVDPPNFVPSGWSPDSQTLYFTYGNPTGLWSVGVDGTGLQQVNSIPGYQVVSPDGTQVAVTRFRSTLLHEVLLVADLDGSGRTPLAHVGPYSFADDVAWSPDGTRVAALRTSPARILVAEADGSSQQVVWRNRAADVAGLDFSPGGGTLVFARRYGGGYDLPTYDLLTLHIETGRTHLVDARNAGGSPAWRP